MNLKAKSKSGTKKLLLVGTGCILGICVVFFLFNLTDAPRDFDPTYSPTTATSTFQPQPIRTETFQELSPDGSSTIYRYKLSNTANLFGNIFTTYLDNNIIISRVENFDDLQREYYIFIGEERTGNPHWLGNNHVFFTSYCGSACQGLILLDVKTGQRWQGVLSSLPNSQSQMFTYFTDWFDQKFRFSGLVESMRGELKNNQPFLVFETINDVGVESGEKRFLFTGSSLVIQK